MSAKTLTVTTTITVALDRDGKITNINYKTNFGYRPDIMRKVLQHAIDGLDVAKETDA